MRKYLLPEKGNFYKANLHCHSTWSDGKHTPSELKELYKSRGYSVLAITDHEGLFYHDELNDDEFASVLSDISTIREEKNRRDEMSEIMIKSAVNKLVARILRGAHKKCEKRKHKDIKSALSYIRYHFRENITMDERESRCC